ncbi:hypothetical protein N473_21250 [Pseudoalteromonas luteoviolacea CPMOR-1]|uniref:Transposase n=1 Tax=Pseudoalteromonas luteoviolacea CPMOR-1 TaxID=1365248 RepID=A0A167K3A7_9GAMM|nr:hypothetical protein N473_21250 [Pseudoalteromonas luteoviolacea CPMOR-1]
MKSEEQQAVLCLHRIQQGLIKDRTANINRLRSLLAKFGIVIHQLARELLTDEWLGIQSLNQ